ncbi:Splicing factor 3A subunit 2 [Choanephora cucurbitarum]|uniref:Splicing factor 3A subunit 2 n=1 Tax=Choanephora cucurbitarum TaxID=101091 RepID=A0A1C7NHQ4_9FUNG|nr:Splicing factor 3A subunit 2 [Choanephora cucurbitarum]
MDFQNRVGSKHRGGGMASYSESNVDRRERLRKLAMETIDITKDPYFMKNHLGSYECKLCLTLHTSEGSYLAHTQGKKHQTNLARRAAKEAKENNMVQAPVGPAKPLVVPRRNIIKIGRPGYRVTKVRDPVTRQLGFLFQIQYPQIAEDVIPRHRFMGAYEQKIEPPNNAYQYLVIAAEPYESISFKIQSTKVDETPGKFWTHWDQDSKQFSLQFFFKNEKSVMFEGMGATPSTATSTPPIAT